jgi:hypothetical protein
MKPLQKKNFTHASPTISVVDRPAIISLPIHSSAPVGSYSSTLLNQEAKISQQKMMQTLVRFILVLFCILLVSAAESKSKRRHHYDVSDEVPFNVNKIGPYSNPSETYEYYDLPFCQPPKIQHIHTHIGEDVTGDHKANSLYDIRFRGEIILAYVVISP